MKKYLVVSYLLLHIVTMNSCKTQDNNYSSEVQFFLDNITNPEIQIDEIIHQNLHLDEMKDASLAEQKFRDSLIKSTLLGIREKLLKCGKVVCNDFISLEKGNMDSLTKDFIGIKDKSKAFFILCDKNPVIPILSRKGKIASFMTMKKGYKKYFLEW